MSWAIWNYSLAYKKIKVIQWKEDTENSNYIFSLSLIDRFYDIYKKKLCALRIK